MKSLAILVALAGAALAADKPTVAVMPFSDLSGGNGRVGEALRETITGDLVEAGGLRVLERSAIDKVIAESNLGAKKSNLDAIGGVRIGTLLGATLIVTGAYQQSGSEVRLTARIIRVATGEIFGAAKADGRVADVLAVQDRLTSQLLVAAGLKAPPPKKRFAIKSWKTMEVYGDIAIESDPARKQQLLQRLLADDPDFVYARRDLDALLGRMKQYGATAAVQLSQQEQAALKQLAGTLTPDERARTQRGLFDAMIKARRYYSLESAATTLLARAGGRSDPELAYALFVARDKLHKHDLALQNGEAYMKAFPTGAHFRVVEGRMKEIIEAKKKRADRRAEYDADVADHRKSFGSNPLAFDHAPCIAARWNNQLNELMLTHCAAFLEKWQRKATGDDVEKILGARFFLVLALAEQGEFHRARPLADKLIADSDAWDQELEALMADWPTDGVAQAPTAR